MPSDIETGEINLPPGSSGVLFVNQRNVSARVVVSDTIAMVLAGQSFLFILPPSEHEFYIYVPGNPPQSQTERTEVGKVRYVYLIPILNPR